jgi:hypothetical protein
MCALVRLAPTWARPDFPGLFFNASSISVRLPHGASPKCPVPLLLVTSGALAWRVDVGERDILALVWPQHRQPVSLE